MLSTLCIYPIEKKETIDTTYIAQAIPQIQQTKEIKGKVNLGIYETNPYYEEINPAATEKKLVQPNKTQRSIDPGSVDTQFYTHLVIGWLKPSPKNVTYQKTTQQKHYANIQEKNSSLSLTSSLFPSYDVLAQITQTNSYVKKTSQQNTTLTQNAPNTQQTQNPPNTQRQNATQTQNPPNTQRQNATQTRNAPTQQQNATQTQNPPNTQQQDASQNPNAPNTQQQNATQTQNPPTQQQSASQNPNAPSTQQQNASPEILPEFSTNITGFASNAKLDKDRRILLKQASESKTKIYLGFGTGFNSIEENKENLKELLSGNQTYLDFYATKLAALTIAGDFDGICLYLPWENQEQAANLATLINKLREALNRYSSQQGFLKHIFLVLPFDSVVTKEIATAQVDLFCPFRHYSTHREIAHHILPLKTKSGDLPSIEAVVTQWTGAGVLENKIIVPIITAALFFPDWHSNHQSFLGTKHRRNEFPSFAYPVTFAYKGLKSDVRWKTVWDKTAHSWYGHSIYHNYWVFESFESIEYKCNWAKNYKGVAIWNINGEYDKDTSLTSDSGKYPEGKTDRETPFPFSKMAHRLLQPQAQTPSQTQ